MPTKTLIAAVIILGAAALGAFILQPLFGWPWQAARLVNEGNVAAGLMGLAVWVAVAAFGAALFRREMRR